ncbi:MAG: hypothetical protein R3C11_25010 [Planctomycetaceae bacterium]
MVEAIFQFEQNLQTPIGKNSGIQKFASLVEQVGEKMPENLMKQDWLWRQYQQRAYTDLYIQADLKAQQKLLAQLTLLAEDAVESKEPREKLQEMNGLLIAGPQLVSGAADWVSKAHQLGKESDQIYGVQIAGMYRLKQDYVGLGWYTEQIEKASVVDAAEAIPILQNMIDYEMTCFDALYDDVGNPEKSPHVTYGWPYDGGFFDKTVKNSQRVCAYTTDEAQGVTLEYEDLDPDAQYVARLTLARPVYKERYAGFQPQKRESIYADEIPLVKEMELPSSLPSNSSLKSSRSYS